MNHEKSLSILVTGATGLVGYHTVKHLAGLGHEIKAVVRPTSNIDELDRLQKSGAKITFIKAGLFDYSILADAIRGSQAVVHAAGAIDPYGSRESIFQTNVEGTKSVLNCAITGGAKQFIHISSLSTITGQHDQVDTLDDVPLVYSGEAYADSKVEAEKVVFEAKDKIAVTCLRPGFIYGPFEKAWLPGLINSLAQGKVMLIDGGLKETNVIFVGNLCRAIAASLLNEKAYGQVYNLTDGQAITKKQLFDTICQGLDLAKPEKHVPGAIASLVCNLVSSIAPSLSVPTQKKLARFSKAAFRLAGLNQGFSIAKAERDLNYKNRIPFADGMDETLAYFAECSKAGLHTAEKAKVRS